MLRGKVKKRIRCIYLCTMLIFACILSKLGYEQIIHHDAILERAMNLWQRDFAVAGTRGSILSSDGTVLAQDMPATSVVVVPAQLEDPKETARQLAEILQADEEVLYEKLTNRVSTQKLQPEGRQIDDEQAAAIEALEMEGVYLVTDARRYYPKGSYLGQVLGFTGIDNQGLAGLELQYDEVLQAQRGSLKIPFDAKGQNVTLYEETYEASGNGLNVVLTIDSHIQDIVEREMRNLMERYEPKQALAIAMDSDTGEILAMVSKPDFDPNSYAEYDADIINRNLPIWMSFEPGSTFKSVTFASALELDLFDMFTDTYYDRGYEIVGGARIKSWRAGGHGLQTFLQVLENSSNPGFVEISRRMGIDRLYDSVKRFGFGEKTGVDLPGESSGIFFEREAMGELEAATVAFGQGISVTPIQLVCAFSAIVNGGTLYTPHITKSIVDPISGDVLAKVQPKAKRQVISEETSELMRYALESVVANGGGKNAYIEGYRIGGKTGTAQKAVDGEYLANEYILSFLSAAPMEDPRIVLYVAVDAPQNDVQYGGTVVAPVVKAMYEDILAYMDVEKSEEQLEKKLVWPETEAIVVEDFIGRDKADVRQEGVRFTFIGEGDTVIDQLPAGGTTLSEEGRVWIYLGEDTFE